MDCSCQHVWPKYRWNLHALHHCAGFACRTMPEWKLRTVHLAFFIIGVGELYSLNRIRFLPIYLLSCGLSG